MLLEVENALRTLVKQQVEDAEVGQEAVALRTHLIIRCGVEVGVGQRMLRANSLAEVDNGIILRWQHDILFRECYLWPHVEQLAHGVHDVEVEVEEEGVPFLEEGSQVVGIKLEERCLAIGRHQRVPVQMSPVAMVRDTNIAHGAFRAVVSFYGHGERLRTVGRCNDTSVAVGLLHKVVVLLNDARHAMQLLVPLYGAEVGGAKKGPTPAPRLRGFPLPVGEGSDVLCCFYLILIFCIFFLLIIHLIINHKDVLNRKLIRNFLSLKHINKQRGVRGRGTEATVLLYKVTYYSIVCKANLSRMVASVPHPPATNKFPQQPTKFLQP